MRTCTPRFCISQTAWPIVFKFGVWVSSHYLSAFQKSWVGYLCTCARADRASVSQERLGRLSSILVCELEVMNYVLNTIHGWGISARAHVHTALLYLRNGLIDCVQILYVDWRSLSTCFAQVIGEVGHLCTCARAPPSPYLRIRVANCAKIWCVARDPIVTRFTRVGGGVTTFARTCPVSLSRKPLSPGIEATPKTDLSLSRSLVHRQTWRLTGIYIYSGNNVLEMESNVNKKKVVAWSRLYRMGCHSLCIKYLRQIKCDCEKSPSHFSGCWRPAGKHWWQRPRTGFIGRTWP